MQKGHILHKNYCLWCLFQYLIRSLKNEYYLHIFSPIQIFLVPKADIFKWGIIILIFFSTKILALHKKFGEIHRKLYNFTFKNGRILKQKCSNSAVKLCVCIPWSWRYCPKFWGTPSMTLKIVNNLNAHKIIIISDNNNFSQMLPV